MPNAQYERDRCRDPMIARTGHSGGALGAIFYKNHTSQKKEDI